MKYGFGVPTRGPLATPDSLVSIAQHGEELGFDFVGVSDHIIIPEGHPLPLPVQPYR